MPIQVALHHETTYNYDRPVFLGPHTVRLRPAPHCRTPVLSYSLKVEPDDHFLNWQQDPYSNYLARFVFLKPTRRLKIEVDLVAEMAVINPFDFFVEESAERYPFVYEPVLAHELIPYREKLPAGPRLQKLVQECRQEGLKTVDLLVAINQRLQRDIRYLIRMEPGVQSPEETLEKACGSCRDSGWLLVQVLRHLGLAARFVSGYLIQLTPDVAPLDGPAGPKADFTDLHAWAEVYVPGAGWIGLDPTSGLLAGEGHLPLACSAEPVSAAPITGGFAWHPDEAPTEDGEGQSELRFRMSVTRIHEDPRVTKPYTDDQWRAINSLGRRVDAALKAGDVRLTMGGEPTFVSIDDMDGVEWNTAALGTHKRTLAGVLLRRLRDRFAPTGLLHFGQSKWYPGESLPRWGLGCYWRKDGEPVWRRKELVAEDDTAYGFDAKLSQRFVQELAARLGVDGGFALSAYEDVWHYLLKERQLPANVDPLRCDLDDPEERRRLARVMEQGLGSVVGHVLPLRHGRWSGEAEWVSGRWFFRREEMYLLPGDSPIGYRLPLDSLPWLSPELRQPTVERDPFAPRGPLPGRDELTQQHRRGSATGLAPDGFREQRLAPLNPQFDPSPPEVVRTALCVEPRQGTLHIFMPPLYAAEDYLALVAAIEETAQTLGTPVRVEGYPPPSDYRLQHFKITPDPGVIEVNVHPAADWDELVEHTHILYDEARQSRLGTEKFMVDGRHTGTGGGNHVVIGGPTPADSPLLRRPDLLRSLVSFWHNHPSLSYLFSGLFVGPTSQAPRVDEARNDSLYELELAFRQVPEAAAVPPWLVDRIFRHLLIDVTGNTHRAEFCIDKLYAPDASGSRQGLLEMRGFEMPPHPQMSLVQQLLVRSLVAEFWRKPYTRPLVRWGTELHDRFLLPHFVWQDFEDVLAELRRDGWPLEAGWFRPHFEFRFPLLGEVQSRGATVQLRTAIEPWLTLGEEAVASGTSRFVDSSVERLQLKASGLTDPRHVLTCNRRRVPLHPTGVPGEFVAGVRFRAWQPPSCLHPTVPVHSPLVFDLVDTWLDRSLAGFTYHVSHPGGRAYEGFPVNANEAESRRRERFSPFGHTPGGFVVPEETPLREFPLTLDLRS